MGKSETKSEGKVVKQGKPLVKLEAEPLAPLKVEPVVQLKAEPVEVKKRGRKPKSAETQHEAKVEVEVSVKTKKNSPKKEKIQTDSKPEPVEQLTLPKVKLSSEAKTGVLEQRQLPKPDPVQLLIEPDTDSEETSTEDVGLDSTNTTVSEVLTLETQQILPADEQKGAVIPIDALKKKYYFIFRTGQGQTIQKIFEVLSSILTDINLKFDKNGCRVFSMDGTHTAIVWLKLEAKNFDQYFYNDSEKEFKIGISAPTINKFIKSINSKDNVCFYIEKEDRDNLTIECENFEAKTKTVNKIHLIEHTEPLNEEDIGQLEYHSFLEIPSGEFKNDCSIFKLISDNLEIRSIGKLVSFKCEGDQGSKEKIVGEQSTSNGEVEVEAEGDDNIIQGTYPLKLLLLFTHATTLCPRVKIYIANDIPICLEYSVGALGNIKFFLAPIVEKTG